MRTMAGLVIFLVVVSCSIEVFASNCSSIKLENVRNCNECIRCGGNWCNKGEKQPCTRTMTDNWCSGDNTKEKLASIAQESRNGTEMSLSYHATTATIGYGPPITLTYPVSGRILPPKVTIVNTTQTSNIEIDIDESKCRKDPARCTTDLVITPKDDFCLADGGQYEYLFVKVGVDHVKEETVLKYHVPCACGCSDYAEKNSPTCHGHGDWACGACDCHNDWSGEFCDIPKCKDRGDILDCIHEEKPGMNCTGNGVCSPCNVCMCNEHGDGWQYFDKEKKCEDLGLTVTLLYDSCFLNPAMTIGPCADWPSVSMVPCNMTVLEETDEYNRTKWVKFMEAKAHFAAKKEGALIYIMGLSSCTDREARGAGDVNVTVPTMIGVVAAVLLVAAAAAGAGYMVYQARLAPAPLNASQYQELGPETSAGINPLYKPPNSSFVNPTYTRSAGAKV